MQNITTLLCLDGGLMGCAHEWLHTFQCRRLLKNFVITETNHPRCQVACGHCGNIQTGENSSKLVPDLGVAINQHVDAHQQTQPGQAGPLPVSCEETSCNNLSVLSSLCWVIRASHIWNRGCYKEQPPLTTACHIARIRQHVKRGSLSYIKLFTP